MDKCQFPSVHSRPEGGRVDSPASSENYTKILFFVNFQLKSEDLVNAYIDRIHAVNPLVNAIHREHFHLALKEAKLVDHMIGQYDDCEIKEVRKIISVFT